MNAAVIPILPLNAPQAASRQRKRQGNKGRPVLPAALAEVQALLGPGPYRRDLLIEYLHRIQDTHRQLATPHLAALAQLLKLAQAEVYEVATFYHHFDVVREAADGSVPIAPALTVRVCSSLACAMAGAPQLLQRLPALLGADVRVIPAPCVGRCEQAPVAVVHQKPVLQATAESVVACVALDEHFDTPAPCTDLDAYRAQGGYTLLADCLQGRRSADAVIAELEHAGLRGLGGAGFPAGR
jgi:formate dehydrogenase